MTIQNEIRTLSPKAYITCETTKDDPEGAKIRSLFLIKDLKNVYFLTVEDEKAKISKKLYASLMDRGYGDYLTIEKSENTRGNQRGLRIPITKYRDNGEPYLEDTFLKNMKVYKDTRSDGRIIVQIRLTAETESELMDNVSSLQRFAKRNGIKTTECLWEKGEINS